MAAHTRRRARGRSRLPTLLALLCGAAFCLSLCAPVGAAAAAAMVAQAQANADGDAALLTAEVSEREEAGGAPKKRLSRGIGKRVKAAMGGGPALSVLEGGRESGAAAGPGGGRRAAVAGGGGSAEQHLGDSAFHTGAADVLFTGMDGDGDGAIEFAEIREFVEDVGGKNADSEDEITHEVSNVISALDENNDQAVSLADMKDYLQHLGSLLSVDEVADWIRHALQLPKSVADIFIEHSVSGYDFVELVQNDGALLKSELGIDRSSVRKRLVSAMKMKLFGMGADPGVPYPIVATPGTCQSISVQWNRQPSFNFPVHKYRLQRKVTGGVELAAAMTKPPTAPSSAAASLAALLSPSAASSAADTSDTNVDVDMSVDVDGDSEVLLPDMDTGAVASAAVSTSSATRSGSSGNDNDDDAHNNRPASLLAHSTDLSAAAIDTPDGAEAAVMSATTTRAHTDHMSGDNSIDGSQAIGTTGAMPHFVAATNAIPPHLSSGGAPAGIGSPVITAPQPNTRSLKSWLLLSAKQAGKGLRRMLPGFGGNNAGSGAGNGRGSRGSGILPDPPEVSNGGWLTVYTGPDMSYFDMDLKADRTYAYRLQAWNALGHSDWAEFQCRTMPTPCEPAGPGMGIGLVATILHWSYRLVVLSAQAVFVLVGIVGALMRIRRVSSNNTGTRATLPFFPALWRAMNYVLHAVARMGVRVPPSLLTNVAALEQSTRTGVVTAASTGVGNAAYRNALPASMLNRNHRASTSHPNLNSLAHSSLQRGCSDNSTTGATLSSTSTAMALNGNGHTAGGRLGEGLRFRPTMRRGTSNELSSSTVATTAASTISLHSTATDSTALVSPVGEDERISSPDSSEGGSEASPELGADHVQRSRWSRRFGRRKPSDASPPRRGFFKSLRSNKSKGEASSTATTRLQTTHRMYPAVTAARPGPGMGNGDAALFANDDYHEYAVHADLGGDHGQGPQGIGVDPAACDRAARGGAYGMQYAEDVDDTCYHCHKQFRLAKRKRHFCSVCHRSFCQKCGVTTHSVLLPCPVPGSCRCQDCAAAVPPSESPPSYHQHVYHAT